MRNKLWLVPIPLIALFSFLQLSFDLGEQGKLTSSFLRNEIFPFSKNTNGILTNIKFKIRGETKPDPRIVIVAADNLAIEKLGRWPWHRLDYARIFNYILNQFHAKLLGIDVVFSEPEKSITPEIEDLIKARNPSLIKEIQKENGDAKFSLLFESNQDEIVMGYAPEICQPAYLLHEECPIDDPGIQKKISDYIQKFGIKSNAAFTPAQLSQSAFPQIITGVFNIDIFKNAAAHAGYFSVNPDPDGFIRNYSLIYNHQNLSYPSLALEMAELALHDQIKIEFDEDTRLKKIHFSKTPDRPIPSTKLGFVGINFKGKSNTYPYISAYDVALAAEDPDFNPELTQRVKDGLKDKFVIFGVSALGIYDMRAFPFDSNTPGVEGHATVLDNLLNGDSLKSSTSIGLPWLPLTLLIVIGFLFSILFSFLEAIPSLIVFAVFLFTLGFIDIGFLFHRNINLPTAFIYLESFLIFALVLSIRYVIEERKKKQIKDTFSHYLAPSVVEMVLRDPSKLVVGGERKDLTILFSDLRGFTSISEKMDPKTLSHFLNEYLGEMTDCVFQNQGTLDKYIGDAIMAFWGAPLSQEDHILRACKAGLNMQKRLSEIAPDFKKRYNIDVGMGVGINSGTVSVGNMGSSKIFAYTVLGDHVNLASRLEGLTRMYQAWVLSTKETMDKLYEKYPDSIHYRVLDSVKVKGKKNAVELVELSFDPFDQSADELFQKARHAFSRREWNAAAGLFKEAGDLFRKAKGTEDPVASVFTARCEHFKTHPPAADWDGSIEMREK